MHDPHDQTIALLVIERGAAWPAWGNEIRDRGQHLVVEAQLPHESLIKFRSRMMHRLLREKEAGAELVAAGYVCALEPAEDSSLPHELASSSLSSAGFSMEGEALADRERPVELGREGAGRMTVERLEFCHLLLQQLEEAPQSQREGGGTSEGEGPHVRGQLIVGSGGWRGHPREAAGRAQLMLLWSELSGRVPGRVVSLRFDDAPSASGSFPAARALGYPAAPGLPNAGGRPGVAGRPKQRGGPGLHARTAGSAGAVSTKGEPKNTGEPKALRATAQRSWTGARSVGDARRVEDGPQSDRPSAVGAES